MAKKSKKSTKKTSKKTRKALTFDSQPRTLTLKFYVEQLMDANARRQYTALWKIKDKDQNAAAICKQMENHYCKLFWDKLANFKYQDYKIVGIYHNLDSTEDKGSPFVPSIEKGHWHVVIWRDNWQAPKKRFRVRTIIDLLGLNYAPELDADIWKKHGAEVVESTIASAVVYLPHETETAIMDGKHQYSRHLLAKNFSDAELDTIFAYYQKIRTKTTTDWDVLDAQAIQRGLNVEDFDSWFKTKLSATQRSQATARVIRKDYEDALHKGVSRIGDITRCSVLIYGTGNMGKTFTTAKTLKALGLRTYEATKGTGKYDGLSALDEAMTFDDVTVSDAKNVFDNRAVVLHRRNSGDRPWIGKYAIVTTNDDPFQAICGMAGILVSKNATYEDLTESERAHYDAIEERLYICHIDEETNKLVVDKPQSRGDQASFNAHDDLFEIFKNEFDKQLSGYHHDSAVSRFDSIFNKNKPKWLKGIYAVYDVNGQPLRNPWNDDSGFGDWHGVKMDMN